MTCNKCGNELIDDDYVPFLANDSTFDFKLCMKCVGKLFNSWLKIPLEIVK